MESSEILLRMDGISKEFPGVLALDDVHLNIYKAEVMALLGENGAGKSTLMKILCGAYSHNGGSILYGGKELTISSPRDAMDKGIAIIHQELNLLPALSVGENIFLGREPVHKSGRIDWKQLYRDAGSYLDYLGADINPRALAGSLSIGDQQMVEIAKALSMKAEILILDEPTDALTDKETDNLFRVVTELRDEGKGIVYISHRLPEVFRICDRVTVLRDGQFIGEEPVSDLDEDRIIEMMVGRRLEEQLPYLPSEPGDELLRLEAMESTVCRDINLSIRKGEVVGIAGLMGAGRTELALTLFGLYPARSGQISIEGEPVTIKTPAEAMRNGITYVSEDRKQMGLFLDLDVKDNITMPALKNFEKLLFRTDDKARNSRVDDFIKLWPSKPQAGTSR